MRGQRRFLTWFVVLLLTLVTLPPCRLAASSDARSAAHHRPLTDEQKADQNLQFMLTLYRSAAEPGGRPKQYRKFGSNTVRLLTASASSVFYLPVSTDHYYAFSAQYQLDLLPSERLIRASLVHLRAWSQTGLPSPRCRARVALSGGDALLSTMEPHQRWKEAHLGARLLRHSGGRLTVRAQYRCTVSGPRAYGIPGAPHLAVPALLLYLEEERDGKDWMMAQLSVAKGGDELTRRLNRWHPSVRRRRRRSPDSVSVLSGLGAALKGDTSVPKNRCKLHPFRLSFEQLDLGHYIAPPVYNPRFCQGDCPRVLTYDYHSPNHAIIQTKIHELGMGDVPPPSCVPYKYMPMSVLVKHEKKVEYKELDDMVAESCTCR
ncbi:bone morphogenetic protein 15 isoform X2 [Stigmatopora argus]